MLPDTRLSLSEQAPWRQGVVLESVAQTRLRCPKGRGCWQRHPEPRCSVQVLQLDQFVFPAKPEEETFLQP